MGKISEILRSRLRKTGEWPAEHPDPNLLAAFAERTLLPRERAVVTAHLAGCADCREYLAVAQSAVIAPPRIEAPAIHWWRWATAAATVAACLVVVVVVHQQRSQPLPATQLAKAVAPAPPEASHTEPVPPATAAAKPKREPAGVGSREAGERSQESGVGMPAAPARANAPAEQKDKVEVKAEAPALAADAVVISPGVAAGAGLHGQDARGGIAGRVLDPSGTPIPHVTVDAIQDATHVKFSATTNDAGSYELRHLKPGIYTLMASVPGFQSYRRTGVEVGMTGRLTIDVPLTIGQVSESVVVSSAQPAGQVYPAPPQMQRAPAQRLAISDSNRLAAGTVGKRQAPQVRWSINASGAVERSVDGGATWERVPVGDGVTFRAVTAAGAEVWAGGSGGAVFHSSDGGVHWAQSAKLPGTVVSIDASNPARVKVATASGETWTTADGGRSWKQE